MKVRRLLAILCVALAGPISNPGVAHSDGDDRGASLTVTGDVETVLTLNLAGLQSFPQTTEHVTFRTHTADEAHTYVGCPLEALITASNPIVDEAAKQPFLTIAIVARGSDGYAATLSWADASSALAKRPALVAWQEDGAPLDRPRLVLPGDVGGARYVTDLTELRVVQLAQTGRGVSIVG